MMHLQSAIIYYFIFNFIFYAPGRNTAATRRRKLSLLSFALPKHRTRGTPQGRRVFFYDLALEPRLAVDAGMQTLLRTEHEHAHTDIRRFFAPERLSALAAADIFENRYAVDYFLSLSRLMRLSGADS